MLNISENRVADFLPDWCHDQVMRNELPPAHRLLKWWLISISILIVVVMCLPWRQNVRAEGEVTTLSPQHRPQTINATIAGQIDQWYVQEGEMVTRGDTIVHIREVKTEYFDPDLVDRTANQVRVKSEAIGAYESKADALAAQISALQQEMTLKRSQLTAKIEQVRLKLESQRADLKQAEIALSIAEAQRLRADSLFEKGIRSKTELENRRQKEQEASAKFVSATNKVGEIEQELAVAQLDLNNVVNEYQNKIAKARSDRFSTLSDRFSAESDLNKTQVELENYSQRQQLYYIIAPQDAYITKVIKPGIGEILKEGEQLVTIMPADYRLAVEMYIRPVDLPLFKLGQEVRFQFDGWPAIVFTGWPNLTIGVFSGEVVAIDNTISQNGKYRLLVGPKPGAEPWPDALRPGSGAMGIALLRRVPVWYELWRQLNGFPPDFYGSSEKSEEKIKTKAPLKSVK